MRVRGSGGGGPRERGQAGFQVVASIVVVALVAIGAASGFNRLLSESGPLERLPERPAESRGEKYAQTLRAFDPPEPAAAPAPGAQGEQDEQDAPGAPRALPEADLRQIAALFDEARRAMAERSADRFAALLDAERMFQEIERLGALPELRPAQKADFVRGLREGMGRSLLETDETLAWVDHEIRAVVPLPEPGEVTVYVRGRNAAGNTVKVRWWLRRHLDGWRAYDMEDLDVGLRLSSAMSVVGGEGFGRPAPWVSRTGELFGVTSQIMAGDLAGAEATLEHLAPVRFPPAFEALRLMHLATARCALGKLREAETAIDRAAALNEDFPILDYLRAVVCNSRGRHAEALAAAGRYAALLGDDAEVLLETGRAHAGLENLEAAVDAFLRGLDDDPDSLDLLIDLGLLLPGSRAHLLADRFAAARAPTALFETLAINLREGGAIAALEAVASRRREIAPDDPGGAYHLAQVRSLQGRAGEATELIREALAQTTPEERPRYHEALREILLGAGRFGDAYREGGPPEEAFAHVAHALLWNGELEDLRALMELHRAVRPDDVRLDFYAAELARRAGDVPAAVERYRAGLARAPDDETRETFRGALVETLYRAGDLREACATVPPRRTTARQLALHCTEERDRESLAELIDVHGAQDPDDPALLLWQAETAWLADDYETVSERLARDSSAILADPTLAPQLHDRLVRASLRAGRFAAALEAARACTAREGDAYYEVVVHAAGGDVEGALAAMERCFALGYPSDAFYADPDAAGALSSTAFARFAERFPPSYAGATDEALPEP